MSLNAFAQRAHQVDPERHGGRNDVTSRDSHRRVLIANTAQVSFFRSDYDGPQISRCPGAIRCRRPGRPKRRAQLTLCQRMQQPGSLLSCLITPLKQQQIQECAPVQQLSELKIALEDQASPIMRKVFDVLFPFGPGWNSILGTFYISS